MWDHGVLHQTGLGYWPGALAGLAGGAAMLVAFALLGTVSETDPLWLPKRLAGVLIGRVETGTSGLLIGLLVHFLLSAGFGIVYAIIVTRLTHELWMTGVAFALTLWVINYWGGHLSAIGREMTKARPAWLSPIAHIVYGGFMALVAEGFASGALHV